MRMALLSLALAVPAAAGSKAKSSEVKDAALKAVAACRAAETPEAKEASCPPAKKAVMDALKRLPNDKDVAGATLDLSDAGYFPLSEKAKRRLVSTAGRK